MNAGAGKDEINVDLQKVRVEDLRVDAGGGDDRVFATLTEVAGDIEVLTGAGHDTLDFVGSEIRWNRGGIRLDTAAGDDGVFSQLLNVTAPRC